MTAITTFIALSTSRYLCYKLSNTAMVARDPIVTCDILSLLVRGAILNRCAPVDSTPPRTGAAPMAP
ncbi:hypothetical protein BS47DRAFT_1354013 [Hydnum rufescens UP504]|uniref:Uncharacterized protein n=1 Tax=Hydnum rufescens UP504 TaxID=1448309 RepID=A0A9P6DKT6_9AGAM|nr:hypothetical protein BS47DRAFT_1354013 [Hydnum rufescens UP504]